MSRNCKWAIPLLALLTLLPTGCKPTEKNYRSAYDAALAKREAQAAENMLPAEGLLSEEGPQRRIVEGDTIFVERMQLSYPEGGRARGWFVAVGVYRMSTNAEAQASALKEKGCAGARAMRAQGDKWYAMADTAANFDDAKGKSILFRKNHPGYPYIGLPGSPVVIESR